MIRDSSYRLTIGQIRFEVITKPSSLTPSAYLLRADKETRSRPKHNSLVEDRKFDVCFLLFLEMEEEEEEEEG